MQNLPERRSIRLREWDYTHAGAYFVTINTAGFQCIFGEVLDGSMQLNEYGQIAESEWRRTAELRQNVELDAYVIMPNHMHGIVMLVDMSHEIGFPLRDVVRAQRAAPEIATTHRQYGDIAKGSLSAIIRAYKSSVTKRINETRGTAGVRVWHRNYYERVIRNEKELGAIREYIINNPACWRDDSAYRFD